MGAEGKCRIIISTIRKHKSFAYDLTMEQGIVSTESSLALRSAEIHPSFYKICPVMSRSGPPPKGAPWDKDLVNFWKKVFDDGRSPLVMRDPLEKKKTWWILEKVFLEMGDPPWWWEVPLERKKTWRILTSPYRRSPLVYWTLSMHRGDFPYSLWLNSPSLFSPLGYIHVPAKYRSGPSYIYIPVYRKIGQNLRQKT